MEKYTEEQWLDILVGDVDQEKALAEVRELEPDRAKLLQKLTEIADPEVGEVNVGIWDRLIHRIRVSFADRLFEKKDMAIPDDAVLGNSIACRRLAGRLAERVRASEGGD